MSEEFEAEWTHNVAADDVSKDALRLNIAPDDIARKALAERLSVVSVDDIKATLTLKRVHGNRTIHVKGHFDAKLTQNCVVTVKTITTEISDDFDAWFSDPDATVSIKKAKRDLLVNKSQAEIPVLEEEDDPEPIIDGHINLGEVVTQFLALSIDPYAQAPDAVYELGDDSEKEIDVTDEMRNPFAKLKDWKHRHGGDESDKGDA